MPSDKVRLRGLRQNQFWLPPTEEPPILSLDSTPSTATSIWKVHYPNRHSCENNTLGNPGTQAPRDGHSRTCRSQQGPTGNSRGKNRGAEHTAAKAKTKPASFTAVDIATSRVASIRVRRVAVATCSTMRPVFTGLWHWVRSEAIRELPSEPWPSVTSQCQSELREFPRFPGRKLPPHHTAGQPPEK